MSLAENLDRIDEQVRANGPLRVRPGPAIVLPFPVQEEGKTQHETLPDVDWDDPLINGIVGGLGVGLIAIVAYLMGSTAYM